MEKSKKITFLEIVKSLRKKWLRNPKTIVQKNKKHKSRQQNKNDLRKELE